MSYMGCPSLPDRSIALVSDDQGHKRLYELYELYESQGVTRVKLIYIKRV